MKLADYSVPKTTPEQTNGAPDGEDGGLIFCSVQEGIARVRKEVPMGTTFFVADESGYPLFAPLAGTPRSFHLVLDGADALPLFSAPDGITCICAAGGKGILQAARYFAEINRVPCYLFPAFAACDGAFEAVGQIEAGATSGQYPLASARVFCDVSAMHGLPAAYARILLTRLALFERRTLRAFCGTDTGDLFERTYAAALSYEEEDGAEKIVAVNVRLRRLEEEGAPMGEGIALSRLLEKDGVKEAEWEAYLQLSALYGAFFKRGEPRRYYVPNYALRALRAGEGLKGYLRVKIPTAEEYAFRAIALEKMRALFLRELNVLSDKRQAQVRTFRLLGGRAEQKDISYLRLRYLPEYVPEGLSAIIRDFGLMEW